MPTWKNPSPQALTTLAAVFVGAMSVAILARGRADQGRGLVDAARSLELSTANCGSALAGMRRRIEQEARVALALGRVSKSIERLFQSRVALQEKWNLLVAQDRPPGTCVAEQARTLRLARSLEDDLGARALESKDVAFSAQSALVNSAIFPTADGTKWGVGSLLSGDVLLSRNNAVVSAAIARLPDEDTQFSHLALVYVDEKNRRAYTIESHLEIGVTVTPIEEYFSDPGRVRVAQFRFHDPVLAAKAASSAFRLADASRQSRKPISDDSWFCTEVVYQGYRMASGEQVELPEFWSTLTPGSRSPLERLGITLDTTFIPADIEVDTRFTLAAEWRDYRKARETRVKDVVLSKVYEWMDREGYGLHADSSAALKPELAVVLDRLPLLKRIVDQRMPINMSRKSLDMILLLEPLAESIQKEVEARDLERVRRGGLPLQAAEIAVLSEEIRVKDLALYRAGKKSVFHGVFHPGT